MSQNQKIWKKHGNNLLVLQPFMDSLITHGEGSYLIDADGHRILDLAAGQFCSILGHNNKEFINRMQAQLEKQIHLGDQYVSPKILETAERLVSLMPNNLEKVVFLSTGSEANECAMRMAKLVTGRTGMLAFTRGYYGISLATSNLSSIHDHPGKVDFQPAPANQLKLITPTCNHCPIGLNYPDCESACLGVSLEMIAQQLENIAAVIIEPIVSAGGMILPPKDYVQKLYHAVHDAGALFIVDEAQTGFGRCGTWFDVEHYDIEPDILVVSKTAGNGYPVAGVVVSKDVGKQLEDKTFTHLSSHQNEPLSVAAVSAVIDIVESQNLVSHSAAMGEYFMQQLDGLKKKYSSIKEVRGRGLMIGMELHAKGHEDEETALSLALLCESKGLHITFSYFEPVIRFIPPLTISKDEIDEAIQILSDAFGEIQSGKINLSKYMPQNQRSGPFVRNMQGSFSPKRIVQKVWSKSPEQLMKKISEKF